MKKCVKRKWEKRETGSEEKHEDEFKDISEKKHEEKRAEKSEEKGEKQFEENSAEKGEKTTIEEQWIAKWREECR